MEIIEIPNSHALALKPASFICDTKLLDCVVVPFHNYLLFSLEWHEVEKVCY